MNSAYATEHDYYIIRDIECRRDAEADTRTDYASGDVGGTETVTSDVYNLSPQDASRTTQEVATIAANPDDGIATEAATCPDCDGTGDDLVRYRACPTCGGSGDFGFDRNGSHAANAYVAYSCPTCHGTGRQSDAHSASEEVR